VPGPPIPLEGRDEGSGPAVLLVHGLGGDRTVWNDVIPVLTAQARVLAPDLRGHGRSPPSDTPSFGFAELEADLVAFLDARAVTRAHVVGLSAGGFLALQLALDRPDRVESLSLVATAAQCDGHTRAVWDEWARVYREEGADAFVLRLLKDLYSPGWLDEHLDLVDRVRAQWRDRDFRAAVAWGAAARGFDVRPFIGRVRAPALVVHGLDDRVVDVAHARFLRQAIRPGELKLLPETGHMVPVERPAESAEAIRAWVAARSRT
jgi:pimeloyl-ACP methyl ester carboxylesterase